MRRVRLVLPLAVALLAIGSSALASLEIKRFDATIDVDPSGTLRVTEEITVTFFTQHHGIEREIPVS